MAMDSNPGAYHLSAAIQSIQRSALQDMLAEASGPDFTSFALGLPAAELFPIADYLEAANHSLTTDKYALQYGPPSSTLKRHIVDLMAMRGVTCTSQQIFLTNGAQQGLIFLSHLLLSPQDTVIVEELSYTGLHQAVGLFSPRLLTVPTDLATGIDVEAVATHLKTTRPAFIYVVSCGHNPMGVNISPDKRARLVRLAEQYQVPIVEDDAYGFLYYDGVEALPLRAIDGRFVFYVGSFSKILAPALRVGWLVVPTTLIPQLEMIKEASDIGTATFAQRTVATFMDTHVLPNHLTRLRENYQQRRDTMVAALKEHFPPSAHWHVPTSGFFMWVTLPPHIDASQLLRKAMAGKIAFVPGTAFAASKEPGIGRNCLRLNFSNCNPAQIQEGIARLGEYIHAF